MRFFSRQIRLLVTITLFANISFFLGGGKSGDLNDKIINIRTRTQIIG